MGTPPNEFELLVAQRHDPKLRQLNESETISTWESLDASDVYCSIVSKAEIRCKILRSRARLPSPIERELGEAV